jgi:hypothetical protein
MTHPGYLATRAQLHAIGLRPGRQGVRALLSPPESPRPYPATGEFPAMTATKAPAAALPPRAALSPRPQGGGRRR